MVSWLKDGEALDKKRVNIRNSDKDSIMFIRTSQRQDSGVYEMTVKVDSFEDKATLTLQIVGEPHMHVFTVTHTHTQACIQHVNFDSLQSKMCDPLWQKSTQHMSTYIRPLALLSAAADAVFRDIAARLILLGLEQTHSALRNTPVMISILHKHGNVSPQSCPAPLPV